MSENKKGYLTDNEGNPSSMRAMSMASLATSIVFGSLVILHRSADKENGLYLTALFLIAAFAPKAVQKFAERTISEKT